MFRSASWVGEGDIRVGRLGGRGRSLLILLLVVWICESVGVILTSVELCVIVNHEHDFPLEDVALD